MPDQPQPIAGVIGVTGPQVSLEEKAHARQMLNALQQIRDRSPRPTGPDPDPHSEAASRSASPKRKKLDDLLAPVLAEAGYKKVAKLTYRGEWSTPEVEHVLTLETYGVPKIYLYGDAGLRNPQASTFADQCTERYADPLILRCLRESGYVHPPWHSPTHFPIGLLIRGKLPWSLDMSTYSPSELARTLAEICAIQACPVREPRHIRVGASGVRRTQRRTGVVGSHRRLLASGDRRISGGCAWREPRDNQGAAAPKRALDERLAR